MKTQKISLSSIDYLVLSRELSKELRGAWVDNVYNHPDYGYYLMVFRSSGIVKKLVIIPGESLFLTRHDYPVPSTPEDSVLRLRRIVCNLRVESVEQHDFDRIIVMSLSRGGFKARLIFEGLKRGVLVLVAEDWRILFTSQRIEMGARSLREGEKYVFPPSNILDPTGAQESLKAALLEYSSEKLGRLIAGRLGFGSKTMGEICRRIGMDPDSNVEGKIPLIIETIGVLVKEAEESPKPRIYYREGRPVDVSGIRLLSLENMEQKEVETVSEALDEYYAKVGFEAAADHEKSSLELSRLVRIRENLASEVEALRNKARMIMENLTGFQAVLDAVRKRENTPADFRILETDYERRIVKILFNDSEFKLNLDSSAASNASSMFEEAKKIEKHLSEIDGKILLLKDKTSVEMRRMIPEKRVERKWFEKFRWNISVNGNLILAGRDAGTNELLVKKYVSDRSMVFHADFIGAPFVTIYNVENPSEEELKEAALMAACYTARAWENKYASLDVYWVRGSQVSKQAPPGQYLPKGAFMIRGEKNFVRDVELKLWIGVSDNGEVVYGSLSKVKAMCRKYAVVLPGENDKNHEAALLAKRFLKDLSLSRNALPELVEKIRSIIPGRHCEALYMPPLPPEQAK
ncbi:MAG: ribosome rescue protein RqcH [Crenarchaeota archaeon]|nr:ribosome rescue protein RqcH [Thermoproteota archaeon]